MTDMSPPMPPLPVDVLRQFLRPRPAPQPACRLFGDGPELSVERVHFPSTRPAQMVLRAGGPDDAPRFLQAEWLGERAEAHAAAETERLARRWQRNPSDGAQVFAADPDCGLVYRLPGYDSRLPGLRLLHDEGFARDRLAAMGCPGPQRVTLVAHRLGKRAVLRLDDGDGRVLYARLRSAGSAAGRESHQRHISLHRTRRDDLRLAEPLAYDEDLGLALYRRLPGRAPRLRGMDGFRDMAAIRAALMGLQALDLTLPGHRPTDELALLDQWATRLGPVFPDVQFRMLGLIERLAHALDDLPDLAPVPCHRDLHEGQILIWGGRAGILDFDTLRASDPAIDLGNLQAHLIFAGLRGGRSARVFADALEHGMPREITGRRARVWRGAAFLRLAMIYRLTSLSPVLLDQLVDEAETCFR